MSQQLRDVLHLVVDKLPFASEAERDSYHDLVDEAVPADEKQAEADEKQAEADEKKAEAEPVATAAAPSVTTSTTTAATPPTVV